MTKELGLFWAIFALSIAVGLTEIASPPDDEDGGSGQPINQPDYFYGEDEYESPEARQVAPPVVGCNMQCPPGQTCVIGTNGSPYCRETRVDPSHPCVPNPCPGGQTCRVKPNWQFSTDYTCGAVGQPYCSTVNCLNGGVCQELLRVCLCSNGYRGDFCEISPGNYPCTPNPCLNGGVCRVVANSAQCSCATGYTGTTCNIPSKTTIDPCLQNPCQNGGTCSPLPSGSVQCSCIGGFSGITCNIPPPPLNPCLANPCHNGGACQMQAGGGLLCSCVAGYSGPRCLQPPTTPCPCQNGGKCTIVSGGSFVCSCTYGYTGTLCETIVADPCATNPCLNGGLCYTDTSGNAACNCQNGYSGLLCETNPPRCVPNPCLNGGVCVETSYSFSCNCPSGYGGTRCEQMPNACTTTPCLNGGICTDYGTYRTCQCQYGYTGNDCQLPPQTDCPLGICLNGGTCRSHGTYATCDCLPNYTGVICDEAVTTNYCANQPCLNGGTCYNGASGFTCACVAGFQGATCATPTVLPCANIPCKNNGICTNIGTSGYACQCQAGWFGSNCEMKVADICATQPCYNGATCRKISATQRACLCTPLFQGIDCKTPINKSGVCAVNPCKGDCTCQESCRHASGYFCRSIAGYLGKDCKVPPPTVVCGNNAITISIGSAFVLEYTSDLSKFQIAVSSTPSGTHVAPCKAVLTGSNYVISIPSPFTACGNTVAKGVGGEETVSNNVFMSLSTSVGFDIPVPIVHFKCVYKNEYSVMSSLKPQIHTVIPTISSIGSKAVPATMELCKVGVCPTQCTAPYTVTGGAVYTVGEKIHLSISTPAQTNMNLAAHEVFLSCSSDVAATTPTAAPVLLVEGGCLASTKPNYMPTTLSQNALGGKICLSFQVPKLTACGLVYIHAKLRYCSSAGTQACASGGTKFCATASRRKRSDDETTYQVLGPIYLLQKENRGTTLLFPGKDLVNTTGVLDDLGHVEKFNLPNFRRNRPKNIASIAIYIILIVVICILCVVAFAFVAKLLLYRFNRKY